MRRALIVAVAAGVLAAPAAAAGAPPGGKGEYWKRCGTEVEGEALLVTTKAHSVRCRPARRVAREYAVEGERHPLGFKCSKPEPSRSGETQRGVCRREGARVKVIFGI